MTFPTLESPSIFLASPEDVGYVRKGIDVMFEKLRKQVANDQNVKMYLWEIEKSKKEFNQYEHAQQQISLLSDDYFRVLLCVFGEKIGSPLDFPEEYKEHLGDFVFHREANEKEYLKFDFKPGDEKHGAFSLTGTVFELLAAFTAHNNSNKKSPVFKILFIGDDSILNDINPINANWGNKRLFNIKQDEKTASEFFDWQSNVYHCQVIQLKNFINFLKKRCHIDAANCIAGNLDDAVEKFELFLKDHFGFVVKATSNPFKGLNFYDTGDSSFFFGRSEWCKDALESFQLLWLDEESLPFFGITGGSGVGKTSLLRAGIIARLNNFEGRFTYKQVILTANDLIPIKGLDPKDFSFIKTPLGKLLEQSLIAITNPTDNSTNTNTNTKQNSLELDEQVSFINLAINQVGNTITKEQPQLAIKFLIDALDGIDTNKKTDLQSKARLVIGLDQFEELIDYRQSHNSCELLSSLFLFFQLACKSKRIGILYTCQTNRLGILSEDQILKTLVKFGQTKHVEHLTETDIKKITCEGFKLANIELSKEIIDELYIRVDTFSGLVVKSALGSEQVRDIQGSVLPLLSLTLLNIYEYCCECRNNLDELKEQQFQDKEENDYEKIADNFNYDRSQYAGSTEPEEKAESVKQTRLTDNGILILELDKDIELKLNIENAITEQADKALKEAKEVRVQWSEDILPSMLRRLVRINTQGNSLYSLPPIAIPKRGAGKILIEALLQNRLLLPVGLEHVRLVHEAVLTWKPAEIWLEKEKELLNAAKILKVSAGEWESKKEIASEYANTHQLKDAGALLRDWFDVFCPEDDTTSLPEDLLLCNYAFSLLEAAKTPNEEIDGLDSKSTHFLTAVQYARLDLVKDYLSSEPSAAKQHRTSKNANAAYIAAITGNDSLFELLLKHGANPTECNQEGWQAIHIAANKSNIRLLDRLVNLGADANEKGNNNVTNLHLAAGNGDDRMLSHLLETYHSDPNAQNTDGWTPLHNACYSSSLLVVQILLNPECSDVISVDASLKDNTGWSALHLASRYGNATIVYALLKYSSTVPNDKTNDDWNALQLAIYSKSAETVIALLEDKRIDLSNETPSKKSIVEHAIDEGGLDILKALLNDPFNRVDPNQSANKREPPLVKACKDRHFELINILLQGGANVNCVRNRDKYTALHISVELGDEKLVKLLLESDSIDKNSLTKKGETPLFLALKRGHFSIATLLLNKGVNINAKHHANLSLIEFAISRKNIELFDFLTAHAAEITSLNKAKQNLVHFAAQKGQVDMLQKLISAGLDPCIVDINQVSPLHLAVELDHFDVVKLLLSITENRAKAIVAKDKLGWSVLHLAAQNASSEIVAYLLENGALVNENADHPPLTALQAAAEVGNKEIVPLLINAGASLLSCNESKDIPLALAIKNAQWETASLLLSAIMKQNLSLDESVITTLKILVKDIWGSTYNKNSFFTDKSLLVMQSLKELGVDLDLIFESFVGNKIKQSKLIFPRFPELGSSFTNIENYPWVKADIYFRDKILERIHPIDGKYSVDSSSTEIKISHLPWYETVQIIQVHDENWNNNELYIYYLFDDDYLFRLNGTSPPIHEVNAKAPICLTKENALHYLRFFCFFVRGDEGPFYVAESDIDPFIYQCINQQDSTTKAVIEGNIRPAELKSVDESGNYLCDAVVFYSTALFVADFRVQKTGMVDMSNDEPIAGDLPCKIYVPIA